MTDDLVPTDKLLQIANQPKYHRIWSVDELETEWDALLSNPPPNAAVTTYGYSKEGRPLQVFSLFPYEVGKNFKLFDKSTWPPVHENMVVLCGMDPAEYLVSQGMHAFVQWPAVETRALIRQRKAVHVVIDADRDGTIRSLFRQEAGDTPDALALRFANGFYRVFGSDPFHKVETGMGFITSGGRYIPARSVHTRALTRLLKFLDPSEMIVGHWGNYGLPYAAASAPGDFGFVAGVGALVHDFSSRTLLPVAQVYSDRPWAEAVAAGVFAYERKQHPTIGGMADFVRDVMGSTMSITKLEFPYLAPRQLPQDNVTVLEAVVHSQIDQARFLAPTVRELKAIVDRRSWDLRFHSAVSGFAEFAEQVASREYLAAVHSALRCPDDGSAFELVGGHLPVLNDVQRRATPLELFDVGKWRFLMAARFGEAARYADTVGLSNVATDLRGRVDESMTGISKTTGFQIVPHAELMRTVAQVAVLALGGTSLRNTAYEFPQSVLENFAPSVADVRRAGEDHPAFHYPDDRWIDASSADLSR